MLTDGLAVYGLGKHIGGIVRPWPLDEFKIPGPDSFLNPLLAGCQVADPPNARAAANADRRAALGTHMEPLGKPRSMAMEAIPTPSAAPFAMPAYSASPELSAMVSAWWTSA
eukprot:1452767-Alexandrium_andersonii.AAC.1